MKLNWFSPLPPARTDIAHYTARIVSALTAHAELTLWTDQTHWDASLARQVTVRHYDLEQMPWAELNRADLTVYNIGNNDQFHGGIWQTSVAHPGMVVLHDFHLHHFFAGLLCGRWNAQSEYRAVMGQLYGPRGRRDAIRLCQGIFPGDEAARRYPLSQLAVQNALGVVVHTRQAFDGLARLAPLPAAYLPLPYEADCRHRRAEAHSAREPYRLIVFGHLGSNRRVDRLLQALAAMPERDRFRLSIYGEVCDEGQVRKLVDELGLRSRVCLHGYVPEEELDAALDEADLAVNLRFPTWGEASGSQLRIWDHALPALVTRVGWYADLPEDSVVFVRPEHEIDDIQRALRGLLADPKRYCRIGRNGRRVLETRHAPRRYAQALVDFAGKVWRFRDRAAAVRLARRVGKTMSDWLGRSAGDKLIESVGRQIALLSGSTPTHRGERAERHLSRSKAACSPSLSGVAEEARIP